MEDSNLSGRPSEWQKPSDRISMFPESILLHILSFLPAKDAIRTSLLSQRWRFLWTFVPVINFAGSLNIDDAENSLNMVSIISNTLIQHQFPKLQKFCLQILHKEAITSAVDIWLQFATRKNVEELELDCDIMDTKLFYDDIGEEDDENNWYILPSNVSNNSILVSLKLVKCKLRYGEGINWRSLKVLSLGKMSLSNDFIGKILCGSPLLEILELCNCWDFDFLHIKSERIRRLVIKGYVSDPAGDLGLKVAAPNIKSLEIWGNLKTRKLSLTCSSSLIHVQLTFRLLNSEGVNDLEYAKNMRELLENLRDVKDLTVGFWCLKVLALLEVETLTSLPSKLEYLRVCTNLTRKEQSGIVRLLSLFGRGFVPLTLVMDTKFRFFPKVKLFSESDDVENYLITLRKYLTAVLERIKTVKFVNWTAEESEIQLALFLLKNARRLENMIIHRFQFRSSVKQEKFLEAAQRILSAPTCSGNSVVMFSQTKPYL